MNRPAAATPPIIDHESDFHGWACQQAKLVRNAQFDRLDLEHIAEELEGLGASQRSELKNRLIVLLQHLLKWQYQPGRRGRSWVNTIDEQRDQISDLLRENPSLKPLLDESIVKAYRSARRHASSETDQDIDTYPRVCPWSYEQLMSDEFWPD